jgi:hypothetical protein
MFRKSEDNKGQALIIVLGALVVLFSAGLAFFSFSQVERVSSVRSIEATRARYIGEAGIVYAKKLLRLDRSANLIDSLGDISFTHFSGVDADLDGDGQNDAGYFNLQDKEGSVIGRFALRVTDEASKLNLNSCSKQSLCQLFSELNISPARIDDLLTGRPYGAIEQIGGILGKSDFVACRKSLGVYSVDAEIDLRRRRRVYVNSSFPQAILQIFIDSAITGAYQKAANLKDAADSDLKQTILDEFILADIPAAALSDSGSWQKVGDLYEAPAGGAPGRFSWSNLPLEDGKYYCVFNFPGQAELRDSFSRLVEVKDGGFDLEIAPLQDEVTSFSQVSLVSDAPRNGLNRKIICGSEALVINELMVNLAQDLPVISPAYIEPGEVKQWALQGVRPGQYYVMLKAMVQGGFIGDVTINNKESNEMQDRNYLPQTVAVGEDGGISIKVKNNSLQRSSFNGILISQEPDGEYIEIVNISNQAIDMSDFIIEALTAQGEIITGWPARIPKGTVIGSYQHLVFAIDNADSSHSPQNLCANGISMRGIWNINGVGLIFDDYQTSIDKTFDLLPFSGARVVLRDAQGQRIDGVEYTGAQAKSFTSLERGDPTYQFDKDNNGFFDGWYESQGQENATPGLTNINAGMYTQDKISKEYIKHDVVESKVPNQSLVSPSEILELANGKPWSKFDLTDIAKIADRISFDSIKLGLAGNYKEGDFAQNSQQEFIAEHLSDVGIWEFKGIPPGSYLMSIKASVDNISKSAQASVATTGEFGDFATVMFETGSALYGIVYSTQSSGVMRMKLINNTQSKLVIKSIELEPLAMTTGRINVNTCGRGVLKSILVNDKLADGIIKNRPIGMRSAGLLGVGDLLYLDAGYLPYLTSFTVKSDVYEIAAKGEVSREGKTFVAVDIRTVVKRGD